MSARKRETSNRSRSSARGRRAGALLGTGVLLALALFALVNYLGWKYHARLDWTADELYTLSEKTRNVLASLERDVEVVVLAGPGGADAPLVDPIAEVLARYDAASPRLSVRSVDPLREPAEAERLLARFGTGYTPGAVQVVMEAGDERRVFEAGDLAEWDFSTLRMGGEPAIRELKAESVLTGALLELSSGETPRVLFTTGHGERRLDDLSGNGLRALQQLLSQSDVEVEEWAPRGGEDVPEDAALVVVAGPKSSFVPPELDAFGRYLDAGGRMLWLLDPRLGASLAAGDEAGDEVGAASSAPSPAGALAGEDALADWLAGYGIRVRRDLVVDPPYTVPFYGDETFFLRSYGPHPAVRALDEVGMQVIASLARSAGRAEEVPEGLAVTELVSTSPDGWAEMNLDALDSLARGEEDVPGPVAVAVAVEEAPDGAADDLGLDAGPDAGADPAPGSEPSVSEPPTAGLRMVVIGDADLAGDTLLPSGGNAAFLDNVVSWLLARESALGIPPKAPERVRLDLTDDQLLTVYGLTALLPLLAVAAGVAVYFRRRR